MCSGSSLVDEGRTLTVREVAQNRDLSLTSVTGTTGFSRQIENVHHSDLSDPTPWMAEGTLLITHGADLASSVADGVRYLDTISKKSVALIVAVGEYLDHVPAELVAHAERLGLPVLEAPRSLALRSIFSYVYHSLASTDMYRLRRTLAVQGQLLDSIVEEISMAEVIDRLAEALNLAVLLYSPEGHVLAASGGRGSLDAAAIWSMIEGVEPERSPGGLVERDGARVCYRRVTIHGELVRVLAAVPYSTHFSVFDELALSYAQRLIALSLVAERETMRVRREMVSALVGEVLTREDDAHEYVEKLRAVGIDLGNPWRVVVLSADFPRGAESRFPSRVEARKASFIECIRDVADECLRAHHIPIIDSTMGNQLVIVAVFGDMVRDKIRRVLEEVRERSAACDAALDVWIGVSGPWIGAWSPAALLRQAEEARRAAQEGAAVQGGVVMFEEGDAKFRLLESQSPDSLAMMSERILRPLIEHDRLHHSALEKTVRVYLRNRMSVHETARDLYIHRNTLHKRLKRIEDILNLDLNSMDDVMEVYVSLKASELAPSGNH
jgi:purine catabolism regulator